MTIFDRLINYFIRASGVRLTAHELARVNSTNYNTTRKELGRLKREGKVKIVGKRTNPKTGRLVNIYEYVEEATEYVKKYLSSILYCGENTAHHGIKKVAYAYTFEPLKDKNITRYDDLYEEIRKHSPNCYELDLMESESFGKNYGYGVENVEIIESDYLFPNIVVKINGVLQR